MTIKDYQYSEMMGARWKRASRVVVENPYSSDVVSATISITEQEALRIGDGSSGEVYTRDVATLTDNFDPHASFDIFDPNTLKPTGNKITQGEVYAILFSFYLKLAEERDAQLALEKAESDAKAIALLQQEETLKKMHVDASVLDAENKAYVADEEIKDQITHDTIVNDMINNREKLRVISSDMADTLFEYEVNGGRALMREKYNDVNAWYNDASRYLQTVSTREVSKPVTLGEDTA